MTARMLVTTLLPSVLASVALAGSLTPPAGPPASTMKPLTDVQPRIAVESLPGTSGALHAIEQPGSYVLTGPLVADAGEAAILVAADHVTLDLDGFLVQGTTGASGIVFDGPRHGVVVRNGSLRGWGMSAVAGDECTGCVAQDLLVQETGADGFHSAIRLGWNARVTHCVVRANSNWTGIQVGDGSLVEDCASNENGNGYELSGESTMIVRSQAMGNATLGIYAQAAAIVSDCLAANDNMGFQGGSNTLIRASSSWGNAIGIHTEGEDCLVEENHVKGNGDWGLHTTIGAGGVVLRHNAVVQNGLGINTDASGVNLVYGNSLSGNTVETYGGGAYGVVLDFSGGITITAGSPWANLHY